jgi:hypothetical protein
MPARSGSDLSGRLARVQSRAEQVRCARDELGSSLAEAYEAGASLRSLADATGLSHEYVRQIVRRVRELDGAALSTELTMSPARLTPLGAPASLDVPEDTRQDPD